MRYEEFKEELLREMRLYVMLQMPHPEEYRIVDLGKCFMNNIEQDVICVLRGQDDIGACVYPEKEYDGYLKGRTILELVKTWTGWHEEPPEKYKKAVNQIKQGWDHIKGKIMLRLIQIGQNFLQRVPWIVLENTDLGIMYQIKIDDSSSMPVTNFIARMWKVSEGELYQTAYQNLQEEKCFFSASEFMDTPIGRLVRETALLKAEEFQYDSKLFYMVYADRIYGTAAIFNQKVMKEVERLFGSKFFLFALNTDRMVLIHITDKESLKDALLYLAERKETSSEDVEFKLSNNMYVWEEGRLSLFEQKE